jgi:DNA-directed RNA polymerase specialized sigma24 family protein
MIFQDAKDTETEVLDRLSVEWLMAKLTAEERDILTLWVVEDYSFEKIGDIVGNKYYGMSMPDTTVRYRKDKILKLLREQREEVGL